MSDKYMATPGSLSPVYCSRACQMLSGRIESHLELNSAVLFFFLIQADIASSLPFWGNVFHGSRSFLLEIVIFHLILALYY